MSPSSPVASTPNRFAAARPASVSASSAAVDAADALVHRSRKPVEIRTRASLDFSVTGLVYCLMLLFMGVAAINTQANLLFGVFGLMVGVLLISGVVSRWVLRHVTVRRILPEYAAVGEPMRMVYDIDNRKRWWPTLSVTIAELDAPGAFDRQPHAYVMHAAAGMRATVAAEVVPTRRGLHRLERYQLATSFPFGFIRRALIRRQGDAVLVHPAQGATEPTALSRFLSAESSGTSRRPREGGADEFYGAREYRAGDPMRMIHWRRSARSSATRTPTNPQGTLIVKQMTRVSPPRLMLLVDTYAPPLVPPPAGTERAQWLAVRAAHLQRLADVERSLATAASLLAAAMRHGLSVGIVAARGKNATNASTKSPAGPTRTGDGGGAGDGETGGPWVEMLPERGKRHSRELLTALALLGRNTEQTADALVAHGLPLASNDTSAVLITGGGGGERGASAGAGDGVDPARQPRHPGQRAGRGNLVVVKTHEPELRRWVRFHPDVDFAAMVSDDA